MPPQPVDLPSGVEPPECPLRADFDTNWHIRKPNILFVDGYAK